MASVKLSNKNLVQTALIANKDFSITRIEDKSPRVSIEETIPFRVRLTSITVPGYSSTNTPGIGIQVIGFSNYIL